MVTKKQTGIDNYFEVNNPHDVSSSNVKDSFYGSIRSFLIDEKNPMPHEFGHLLGLEDKYRGETPLEGWQGNIMAERAGQGIVEFRNVQTILRPLVQEHSKMSSIAKFFNSVFYGYEAVRYINKNNK